MLLTSVPVCQIALMLHHLQNLSLFMIHLNGNPFILVASLTWVQVLVFTKYVPSKLHVNVGQRLVNDSFFQSGHYQDMKKLVEVTCFLCSKAILICSRL